MRISHDQNNNWFCLRKPTIFLVTFVTLMLSFFVEYTPAGIFQEGQILIRSLLLGPCISTCSYAADRRGNNQKMIGYSLYGNFSREEHMFGSI